MARADLRLRLPSQRYFEQEEEVELSPRNFGILMHKAFENADDEEQIRLAVERMQADGTLSAAEAAALRRMIARALAQDTPVILLDEPTAFLDLPNRYELATLLRRLTRDEGKCILFSTHDLDVALSLCDSVALIDTPSLHHLPAGEMVGSGLIERLFSGENARFDPETRTVRLR